MPPSASEKAASDGKENKEGAITDAVVSRAVDALRREEGTRGVIAVSKGRKRYRGPEAIEGDRQGAEDEETVGTAAGRMVESPMLAPRGYGTAVLSTGPKRILMRAKNARSL